MDSRILSAIRLTGYGTWGLVGLSGLLLGLEMARQAAGLWGLVAASAVFPVTVAAAPWLALLAWNTWLPVLFVYGGGTLGTALIALSTPPASTS